MTLKDLYLKMKTSQMTIEELIAALPPLTNDEKLIAIKCYSFFYHNGKIVSFFADFTKNYSKLMKDLEIEHDKQHASRSAGNLVREKIYKDLVKETE